MHRAFKARLEKHREIFTSTSASLKTSDGEWFSIGQLAYSRGQDEHCPSSYDPCIGHSSKRDWRSIGRFCPPPRPHQPLRKPLPWQAHPVMMNGVSLGNLPTAAAGGKMIIAHQVTIHASGILQSEIGEASGDFVHHHVHISLSENL